MVISGMQPLIWNQLAIVLGTQLLPDQDRIHTKVYTLICYR